MKIKIYKLDAFTKKRFSGNQAAVCVLKEWLDDETMQNIAAENNLSETAFIVKKEKFYEIRWFTPMIEVDLCGHATLASAYVLFNVYKETNDNIVFQSHLSGELRVSRGEEGVLILDFPTDEIAKCEIPKIIKSSFSIEPKECLKGKTDYLLVYETKSQIEKIQVDLKKLSECDGRGVIITAPGDEVDFVSRFFAPQSGIDEDPVTGSAHTTLTPYWSEKLERKKLTAKQLSKRQGDLVCEDKGERVMIGGSAVLFLEGEIYI